MEKDKDKAAPPKQEQSIAEHLISLGAEELKPSGKGFVIGTGGPVEKKDDEAK